MKTSTTLNYHEQMVKKENDEWSNLLNEAKTRFEAVNKEKKRKRKRKRKMIYLLIVHRMNMILKKEKTLILMML
jgi:hypothetical protein